MANYTGYTNLADEMFDTDLLFGELTPQQQIELDNAQWVNDNLHRYNLPGHLPEHRIALLLNSAKSFVPSPKFNIERECCDDNDLAWYEQESFSFWC